jgi:FKBP-type peptidyl-prolyl cis-trans isomerase
MKTLFIGILVILLLGVVGFVMSLNKTPEGENNQQTQKEPMTSNELQIEDIVVGEGKEATPGTLIVVHYTGTLLNGNKFDSSLDRGEPFQFVLGAGSVIQGWDQGVAGMKVGGKRKLIIPPQLAYGNQSVGAIPPNSTLVFEVELLDVQK